jgi:7,8-dihydropterin-6-yl-methyl-4-(beta-D-ribofuranosyl)aminobenzene 5'-phosphate synthase
MKLTIVYDNEVYKKNKGFISDWGFSCLIETAYDMILFDTGAKGNILFHNLNKLEIDPNNINKIVISHEHWDHKGGLKVLSQFFDGVNLYELVKVNPNSNIDIKVPEKPEKITENIWTTGRIKGVVDEQSLVLNGKKGWFVLVGCSHPGVENILNIAKQFGDIIGLIGGFHGFNNFMVLEGLNVICPCHCTKHIREIKKRYPMSYIKGGIGRIIEI